MWNLLLAIYEANLLNVGEPKCLFAETQIFNEGWLLRSVLQAWKTNSPASESPFLPIPKDAKVYSEAQLFTPFKVRRRSERAGEPKGETNTRVDGIAGYFSIAPGTKSGIELDRGCPYIAVFEAKLYSPLSTGITHAPKYDQVSRTTACLIHALLEAKPKDGSEAHLVVLYPADHPRIDPGRYEKNHVKHRIASRLKGYKDAGKATDEIRQFETGWEEMSEYVDVHFVTWEDVVDEIDDVELHWFYGLCRQFNGPQTHS
jgi:hypothetical protein